MGLEYNFSFPGGKQVEASFGKFTVRTDQPRATGGAEDYPDPLDYFFVALGACSAGIVREFCASRDISLGGMSVRVVAAKNAESKLYDTIELLLTLPSDFPDKYRKAVLRAVQQCSVKRHIQGDLDISSRIAGEQE